MNFKKMCSGYLGKMANLFRFPNRKSKVKLKKTHQGISPVLDLKCERISSPQQTRIIVLEPNSEIKPKNILHSGDLFDEEEDDYCRESREVAKEMSEHQRKNETLVSSVLSNGNLGDASLINKWKSELAKEIKKEISQQLRKKLGKHESEVNVEDMKVLCTSRNKVVTRLSSVDDMKKLSMEIGALQAVSNKLEVEFKKTKEIVIKEREAATKIDEMEKKYEDTNKLSDERLKNAMSMVLTLKTNVHRLEEKKSDIEAEKKILPPIAPLKEILENGHHDEEVDALMESVMKDVGFRQGKPVAGFMIYKCLMHWKSFEADRTTVFDRLNQMIGSAIQNQDSNDRMAYWLSNTSALLFLLQKSLKPAGSPNAASACRPQPRTSLLRKMTLGFRSCSSSVSLVVASASLDTVRQVEAKYPALRFKQQITAYVEKIYSIIRDNLKMELGSLLALCIQAPRTSKGNVLRSFGKNSTSNHWQSIIDRLNTLLVTLKENLVPPVLVQKIFTQTFSYMNVQLFNSLLLRRECCTFSNGEYVKSGLAKLELWCCQAKQEYAGLAWDELKHIRQSVGFLVMRQKYKISYDKLTNDLCPILSVQQLYRICTLYNPRSVSAEVISSMRVLMTEDSNNEIGNSFLLDDNSSIPCSTDELSSSFHVKDFLDVKPAEDLLQNPAFLFLYN